MILTPHQRAKASTKFDLFRSILRDVAMLAAAFAAAAATFLYLLGGSR